MPGWRVAPGVVGARACPEEERLLKARQYLSALPENPSPAEVLVLWLREERTLMARVVPVDYPMPGWRWLRSRWLWLYSEQSM